MSELVKICKEQLEKQYQESRKVMEEANRSALDRAAIELGKRYESIVSQLELLKAGGLPFDALGFFIKTAGKVWVSKLVYIQEESNKINTTAGNRVLNWEDPFVVPAGMYKIVVMAIPQEKLPEVDAIGFARDEYGTPFQPKQKPS